MRSSPLARSERLKQPNRPTSPPPIPDESPCLVVEEEMWPTMWGGGGGGGSPSSTPNTPCRLEISGVRSSEGTRWFAAVPRQRRGA